MRQIEIRASNSTWTALKVMVALPLLGVVARPAKPAGPSSPSASSQAQGSVRTERAPSGTLSITNRPPSTNGRPAPTGNPDRGKNGAPQHIDPNDPAFLAITASNRLGDILTEVITNKELRYGTSDFKHSASTFQGGGYLEGVKFGQQIRKVILEKWPNATPFEVASGVSGWLGFYTEKFPRIAPNLFGKNTHSSTDCYVYFRMGSALIDGAFNQYKDLRNPPDKRATATLLLGGQTEGHYWIGIKIPLSDGRVLVLPLDMQNAAFNRRRNLQWNQFSPIPNTPERLMEYNASHEDHFLQYRTN